MLYKFGTFRFDGSLRRLYRNDALIALTPKAAETLLVLLERAGRVVEKDELLRVVWGDVFVGEDTLAQNISTLRRALGDEASRPQFIATMPRRGYRFVARVSRQDDADSSELKPQPTPKRLTLAAIGWAAAIGLAVVLFGVAVRRAWMADDIPRPVVEFTVSEPESHRFSASGSMLAVSPDGEHLAFVATDASGSDALWLRPIGSTAYRLLEGSEGASQPFWSPDNRTIGFFADKRLKAVDVVSGAVRVVAPLTNARALGATWSRRGQILFSVPGEGMYVVAASGGLPSRVTPSVDDACGGCSAWPSFLPDGRHFVYTTTPAKGTTPGVYIGELGRADGQLLVDAFSSCAYLAPGLLLFARDGTLYVQPFDAKRLRIQDRPRPVVDSVAVNQRTGRVVASMSESGVLAFRRQLITELVRVDRRGATQSIVASPAIYMDFSIAPDGKRVAAARVDAHTGASDVWVFVDGVETRVTNGPESNGSPVWTADGTHVIYSSRRGNRWSIHRRSTIPLGPEELLLKTDAPTTPLQVMPSSDVIYSDRGSPPFDLWRLTDGKSGALAKVGGFYPSDARLSPDSTWLAYGHPETSFGVASQTLYLAKPSVATDRRVIADRASSPRWRADGRELFYLSQDSSVVAVSLDEAYGADHTGRNVLFRTMSAATTGLLGSLYEVAPDGHGFVIKREVGSVPIQVRVNGAVR